jgi:hypothetical protein
MSTMPIVLFKDAVKAEPLKKRLEQCGISAQVHDWLHLEKLWFTSSREAGAHIEVPSDQFERACQLLDAWEKEGALNEAIRCPECNSYRIDYPQFSRKSFIPNVMLGIAATIGIVEKDYYCQDCHYTWPKHGNKLPRHRPNSAPAYFIEGIEQTRSETKKRSN